MAKKHSTKKALIASILLLCLCFTTLVGTTFAWFTDSASSTNNIIKTGKLDIELEYATVVDGNITDWKLVKGADKIFDPNALWEPGRVEVVYLKASNLGNLALKYQLAVNIAGEVSGVNVAGEEFKLSDHLVFKVVPMPDALTTYSDREAIKVAAGTEKGLKDYSGKVTPLEVGGVDYMAMIVYMPETVGNEANYRGDAVPTITLGVNMYATQQVSESDSISNNYDEGAWHNAMTVATIGELKNVLANIQEGGVIRLANDIVVTEADAENGNALYYAGDKSFTIDLNGFTFKGDTSNAAIRIQKAAGAENTITIKNGSVVAGENAWSAISVGSSADTKTYVNLTNLVVSSSKANDMAIRARSGAEFTITDCKVTATNGAGGIAAGGGNVTLNNVTVNQSGVYNWNSVALGVSNGATMTVNSGAYNSDPQGNAKGNWIAYVMSSGGYLTINDGTFKGTTATTANASNACGLICADKAAVVTINGGVFQSNGAILDMRNNVGTQPNPTATIAGGIFSANPTVSGLYSSNLIKVADGRVVMDHGDGTWGVYATSGEAVTLADGAVLDLKGVAFNGTVVAEGDLTIVGDTTLGTLKATKGGTITLTSATRAAVGPTLTLNNFSFGSKDTAGAKYVIQGGTVVANYGFFQHGEYDLYANFETGYMYYSYGSDITVYGTFHSQGKGDGLDYVRGKLTVANGGKSIHDKSLWVGQPASWGAMNATLVVEDGGYVEANSLSVYDGSYLVKAENAELKYNSVSGEDKIHVEIADGLCKNDKTAANDYYVYNAEGLAALNAMMADQSAGRDAVVNLLCDIDFAGKVWTTVDSHTDAKFELAEINGNGYTIYNLTINGQAMFSRFAGTGDVVIKNITFDGAKVTSGAINTSILTVQSYQNVLLDNVDVKNSTITGGYKVAVLIGTVYNEGASTVTATVKNCDIDNCVVTSTLYDFGTCGFIGYVAEGDNDYVVFENSTISNTKICSTATSYTLHAFLYYNGQGDAGCINEATGVTVTNCVFDTLN